MHPTRVVRQAATLLAAVLDGALTLAMLVIAASRASNVTYHSAPSNVCRARRRVRRLRALNQVLGS